MGIVCHHLIQMLSHCLCVSQNNCPIQQNSMRVLTKPQQVLQVGATSTNSKMEQPEGQDDHHRMVLPERKYHYAKILKSEKFRTVGLRGTEARDPSPEGSASHTSAKKDYDNSLSEHLDKKFSKYFLEPPTITYSYPPSMQTQSQILQQISSILTLTESTCSSYHPSKLTPEPLLQSLSSYQQLQPIQYNSSKFKQIWRNLQCILRNLEIMERDILIAYGTTMQVYYVFFNASHIRVGCAKCNSGPVFGVVDRGGAMEDRYRVRALDAQDTNNLDKDKERLRRILKSGASHYTEKETEVKSNLHSKTKIQSHNISQGGTNKEIKETRESLPKGQTEPLFPKISEQGTQKPSSSMSITLTCNSCRHNLMRFVILTTTGVAVGVPSEPNLSRTPNKASPYLFDQKPMLPSLQKLSTHTSQHDNLLIYNQDIEHDERRKRKMMAIQERYKVGLCVKVASGRFKRMRIVGEDSKDRKSYETALGNDSEPNNNKMRYYSNQLGISTEFQLPYFLIQPRGSIQEDRRDTNHIVQPNGKKTEEENSAKRVNKLRTQKKEDRIKPEMFSKKKKEKSENNLSDGQGLLTQQERKAMEDNLQNISKTLAKEKVKTITRNKHQF